LNGTLQFPSRPIVTLPREPVAHAIGELNAAIQDLDAALQDAYVAGNTNVLHQLNQLIGTYVLLLQARETTCLDLAAKVK